MATSCSLALRESRVLFPTFYANASADDSVAMDVLVMAYISVTLGITLPRKHLADSLRMRIERDCDNAEREFVAARDRIRECPTYLSLALPEQKRVASLFELFLPTE